MRILPIEIAKGKRTRVRSQLDVAIHYFTDSIENRLTL
jgi:hypothetical protein